MFEFLSLGGTFLILIFSGLTFWYQFLRTPRSNIGASIVMGDEPHSTNSDAITLSYPSIQFFNEGAMEGYVAEATVSAELFHRNQRDKLEIPEDSEFEVSIDKRNIGNHGKLPSGSNDQVAAKIDIWGLRNFPREFFIEVSYNFEIKDNLREYELGDSHRFKFIHERDDS